MEEEEDDQEYEVTAFLYVITFPASEDEPERHVFCVNWNHEITISWTTGDYPEALRELIDEGSYWIENENCEDDAQEENGKMPPYDFCFDLKTDLPLEGFPLVVTRDYRAEWKKEWKQKRRNNVNARRKIDDADEVFVVADDVGVCVGEVGDEGLDVQEEEEEEEEVVESGNTVSGRKRARPSGAQEEEERFAVAQTQEFFDTEAKELLRCQILDEIRKRCVDTFHYEVLICDKNANEEYLVYGLGICRICSSNVLCWKKAGLVIVSFDDWLAKARGSAFRAGGFRDHICRPGPGNRAGSADQNNARSSARIEGRNLSPEEVADLITKRYGLFLGKLNPQAFKDASYRRRHISAAKKLIPTMFSIPSFLSRLKVPICLFSIFLLSLID